MQKPEDRLEGGGRGGKRKRGEAGENGKVRICYHDQRKREKERESEREREGKREREREKEREREGERERERGSLRKRERAAGEADRGHGLSTGGWTLHSTQVDMSTYPSLGH